MLLQVGFLRPLKIGMHSSQSHRAQKTRASGPRRAGEESGELRPVESWLQTFPSSALYPPFSPPGPADAAMPRGPGPEEKNAWDGEGKGRYFRNLRGSWAGPSGSRGCEARAPPPADTGRRIPGTGTGRHRDEDAAAGADAEAEAAAQSDSRSHRPTRGPSAGSMLPGALSGPGPSAAAAPARACGPRGYSPGGLTAAGVAILHGGRRGARRPGRRRPGRRRHTKDARAALLAPAAASAAAPASRLRPASASASRAGLCQAARGAGRGSPVQAVAPRDLRPRAVGPPSRGRLVEGHPLGPQVCASPARLVSVCPQPRRPGVRGRTAEGRCPQAGCQGGGGGGAGH